MDGAQLLFDLKFEQIECKIGVFNGKYEKKICAAIDKKVFLFRKVGLWEIRIWNGRMSF